MQALIVDDSRAMRSVLRKIVTEIGFEVTEAGNGREGLERLQQGERPEFALVDWNMPEMNGLEFIEAVRANPEFTDLKLVMVTTETEPARMAKAFMAGVDEFVMKPFTPQILIDKLRLIGVQFGSAGSA